MSKYTPGPWRVSNEVGVSANPKGLLAFADTDLHSKEEAIANAGLIAAAPELLEALKLALAPCDKCEGTGRLDSPTPGHAKSWASPCHVCGGTGMDATNALSWGDIQHVIAKAEGRES
jgi:hypothetical protein